MPLPTDSADFVTGAGRPRIHASDGARLAAYRSRNVRVESYVSRDTAQTLRSIASDLDCSRTQLLESLIKFALTNRDWRRMGLWGSANVDRIRSGLDSGSGNTPAT